MAFYNAMVRRQAVEEMVQRKNLIVAAVHSNPNWDEEGNDKEGFFKNLEYGFNQAMEYIYHPELIERDRKKKEEVIDWSHPFWQAAKRNIQRTHERYGRPNDKRSIIDLAEQEEETKERIAAADKMIKSIDQM